MTASNAEQASKEHVNTWVGLVLKARCPGSAWFHRRKTRRALLSELMSAFATVVRMIVSAIGRRLAACLNMLSMPEVEIESH